MEAIKTVLYAAIGIRRKADHERARVHPAYIIAAAIIFVVLFILAPFFVATMFAAPISSWTARRVRFSSTIINVTMNTALRLATIRLT